MTTHSISIKVVIDEETGLTQHYLLIDRSASQSRQKEKKYIVKVAGIIISKDINKLVSSGKTNLQRRRGEITKI